MDKKEIKRKSRQASFISIIGFLIILIAFIYAALRLDKLNNTIQINKETLSMQDSILTTQNNEIKTKQNLIKDLIEELDKYKDSEITANTKAVKLDGIFMSGRQIYDFTIWLTAGEETLNFIDNVKYKFNHESFILKERESAESSNGFLVSYRGWGCLQLVEIHIEYKDKEKEVVYFNMCENIRDFEFD